MPTQMLSKSRQSVYFLRHAQSHHNIDLVRAKANPLEDVGLTQEGLNQAQTLGKKIKDLDISVFHCSSALRSKKTAQIINENRVHTAPLKINTKLNECDFQIWHELQSLNAFDRDSSAKLGKFLRQVEEFWQNFDFSDQSMIVGHGGFYIASCLFFKIPTHKIKNAHLVRLYQFGSDSKWRIEPIHNPY